MKAELRAVWDAFIVALIWTGMIFFANMVACFAGIGCLVKQPIIWLWAMIFAGIWGYYSTSIIVSEWRTAKDKENKEKEEKSNETTNRDAKAKDA